MTLLTVYGSEVQNGGTLRATTVRATAAGGALRRDRSRGVRL